MTDRYLAVTLLAAVAANVGVLGALGVSRPIESDAVYYAEIAGNLAAGRGYINTRSPWPAAPAMDRLPGWTGVLAAALTLTGGSVPTPILIRVLNGALNVAVAMMLAYLTFRVTRNRTVALVAGVGYAVYLPALALTDQGLSEISFLIVLLSAAFLLLQRRHILACFLLGLGCYFRGNMILLPPFLAAYLWFAARLRIPVLVACLAAFSIAPGAWIARNATAMPGCFPMMTAAAGEVVRGSLNDLVADTWQYWGSWIFANDLPGEAKFQELAATRNQCEVSKYYQARATAWAKEHWTKIPGVIVGRLLRAYTPFTLSTDLPSLAGFSCRAVLIALVALGWRRWRAMIDPEYQRILLMLFGVSLATTVLTVAGARHSFWLEAVSVPLAAATAAAWWGGRKATAEMLP